MALGPACKMLLLPGMGISFIKYKTLADLSLAFNHILTKETAAWFIRSFP
jgi:hypothetical protein